VPLHSAHDGERPALAIANGDDLAQLRWCVLDGRDEPAAAVAAIGHPPRRAVHAPRDRFRVERRVDHLRDFVIARGHRRRARGVGQPLDLGDRTGQRLQPDHDAYVALDLVPWRARRVGDRLRPEQRRQAHQQ
jgi:hypothetical protein